MKMQLFFNGKQWTEYSSGWTEPNTDDIPGAWAEPKFVEALKAYHNGDMKTYHECRDCIKAGANNGKFDRMLDKLEIVLG